MLRRHALPAAAAPVIAATGMTVNLTITNVILMETVFGIPGVFGRLRGAIGYGDFPMLMGITSSAPRSSRSRTCSRTSRSPGSTRGRGRRQPAS